MRAIVVFAVVVLMLVVLLFIGTTLTVRTTILSERFWVETASIALDPERLEPLVTATAIADVELLVDAAEAIDAARRAMILLGLPGRPVQTSVERFITSVFRYLDGDIPVDQVPPLLTKEAVDAIASGISEGFARGDYDGTPGLDALRGLSPAQRRQAVAQMVATLQERLDFYDVPVGLIEHTDPAALRHFRSHYVDRRRTVNGALVSAVVAFFILAAVILIAWRRDPLRGLRRIGVPFVLLGTLALVGYAAVRFLGSSVTEQVLRTLIEQPDTSSAEATTIIAWMAQVHRYLAAIYLRALQPVLTMAIVSLVTGTVLIVLPRFRTDSGFHSMTTD
ncbi:MAG: hypothetical protein EA403_13915 [Spirochaetaceae bacterium]|nr:MAG: hypothetical protein EA403_13915 [Spirochaetaceae bacterium]